MPQLMEEFKVSLRDEDLIFHDTFGTSRTDHNGYFTVSGQAGDLWGNPEPYIRVEYQYSGYYGKMDVRKTQSQLIVVTKPQ